MTKPFKLPAPFLCKYAIGHRRASVVIRRCRSPASSTQGIFGTLPHCWSWNVMPGSQLGLQFFRDCDTWSPPAQTRLYIWKIMFFSVFHSVCVVVSIEHNGHFHKKKKQNLAWQGCASQRPYCFCFKIWILWLFFFLFTSRRWNWVDWWWAEGWCSSCTSRDGGLTHRWGHRPLACPLTRHLMTAHAKGAKAKPKCPHGK